MTPTPVDSPRRLSPGAVQPNGNAKLSLWAVDGWLQRASVTGGGLYERLLQRLALALDEADTAERLRDEHPTELELRGLSEAEMGLIRAYLDQDLHWLRGWHAAAEEHPGRPGRNRRRRVGTSR